MKPMADRSSERAVSEADKKTHTPRPEKQSAANMLVALHEYDADD